MHADLDLAHQHLQQVEDWFDNGVVGPNLSIFENNLAEGRARDPSQVPWAEP